MRYIYSYCNPRRSFVDINNTVDQIFPFALNPNIYRISFIEYSAILAIYNKDKAIIRIIRIAINNKEKSVLNF